MNEQKEKAFRLQGKLAGRQEEREKVVAYLLDWAEKVNNGQFALIEPAAFLQAIAMYIAEGKHRGVDNV